MVFTFCKNKKRYDFLKILLENVLDMTPEKKLALLFFKTR